MYYITFLCFQYNSFPGQSSLPACCQLELRRPHLFFFFRLFCVFRHDETAGQRLARYTVPGEGKGRKHRESTSFTILSLTKKLTARPRASAFSRIRVASVIFCPRGFRHELFFRVPDFIVSRVVFLLRFTRLSSLDAFHKAWTGGMLRDFYLLFFLLCLLQQFIFFVSTVRCHFLFSLVLFKCVMSFNDGRLVRWFGVSLVWSPLHRPALCTQKSIILWIAMGQKKRTF